MDNQLDLPNLRSQQHLALQGLSREKPPKRTSEPSHCPRPELQTKSRKFGKLQSEPIQQPAEHPPELLPGSVWEGHFLRGQDSQHPSAHVTINNK